MRTAIEVTGVTKRYGQTQALRSVDLDVAEGTIVGLLGPNGAGKTTMVRILSTLERPDEGRVTIEGLDVVREARQVRQRIGLTGQFSAVDEDISGRENLYMIGRLLNQNHRQARARADDMLERFGLAGVAGKSARKYSGGMRRRLDLALSLMGDPRVLYLDEPTTGLDPHSRNAFWDLITTLAARGTTILLTTQYMEEADALADKVTVLCGGRVIATGAPSELRARVGGRVLHIQPARPSDRLAVAAALARAGLNPVPLGTEGGGTGGGVSSPEEADDGDAMVRLPIVDESQLTYALQALTSSGASIAAIDTRVPSLDEVFLILTGQHAAGTELARDKEPA